MSYLASSFGGLVVGVALVPRVGLKGLPIAFILAESAACYHFVISDACRIVGVAYGWFACRLWLGLTVIGGSAFCATWAVHLAPGLGMFPRWVCSGCASIVAVALTAWLVWFRKEERLFVSRKAGSGLRVLERVLPLRLRSDY